MKTNTCTYIKRVRYLDHVVIYHCAIAKAADFSLHMVEVSGFLFGPEMTEI